MDFPLKQAIGVWEGYERGMFKKYSVQNISLYGFDRFIFAVWLLGAISKLFINKTEHFALL